MKYEIGSRIKKFRLERGLTQKQLAESIGVSGSCVSNWEQGLNRPDADILAALCRALNVSPSELLDVKLTADHYSLKEKRLIEAYRAKTDLQKAVDILLGLSDNE